jgi:hypothetical protein
MASFVLNKIIVLLKITLFAHPLNNFLGVFSFQMILTSIKWNSNNFTEPKQQINYYARKVNP